MTDLMFVILAILASIVAGWQAARSTEGNNCGGLWAAYAGLMCGAFIMAAVWQHAP